MIGVSNQVQRIIYVLTAVPHIMGLSTVKSHSHSTLSLTDFHQPLLVIPFIGMEHNGCYKTNLEVFAPPRHMTR